MEPLPDPPARIADVAARAGVGIATVSRVINERGSVAPATRERVQAAIRALEYRPSSVAQNLSLKRTLVIGVVLPFLTEASPIERVRGVVTALASSPYDIALYDVESADRQPRAFRLLADAAPARGPADGGVRRIGRPGARRPRGGPRARDRGAGRAVGDRVRRHRDRLVRGADHGPPTALRKRPPRRRAAAAGARRRAAART